MKKFLYMIFLIPLLSYGQGAIKEKGDFADGLVVVEFNASFNSANEVPWLGKLIDCTTDRVDIAADSRWAKEYKIVVVPTLVIFNNGEEVKRFQANIMMQLEANETDVQEAVDEVIMSAF